MLENESNLFFNSLYNIYWTLVIVATELLSLNKPTKIDLLQSFGSDKDNVFNITPSVMKLNS